MIRRIGARPLRQLASAAIELRGELVTTSASGNIDAGLMALIADTTATLDALVVAPAEAITVTRAMITDTPGSDEPSPLRAG